MRLAAGILMIIYGVLLAFYGSSGLAMDIWRAPGYSLALDLFVIISGVCCAAGGVFCLGRRYWKVCFGSALLLLLLMIQQLTLFVGNLYFDVRVLIFILVMIGGIFPTILVYLRRRDWQKSQA